MKKIILLVVVALFTFSCSTEPLATDSGAISKTNDSTAKFASSAKSPSAASTSNWGDYNIAVSVSTDGSEWTYTITKAKSSAKTLSHFIIDLNNCGEDSATFGDILWATVNGVPTDLSPTEGKGTTCNPQDTTNNFVKFPAFSAASSWTLVLKFDRGYETFISAAAWIKAGTSCNQGVISAPGCPKEDYCSFSQGFFFGNGSEKNGASDLWANGLAIGGISYTQEQGNNAWDIDRGPGGDITLNAFFQLAAVRLSGVESQVATDAAIIDAYFNGMDIFSKLAIGTKGNNSTYQYFNLPASVTNTLTNVTTTTAMVDAAGTRIAEYIETHHCQ
ncbi:hypothetical protein [Flavobacterium sp.]|uniref:hypothetical protein n=1 Tax=Flavobacterium sp. TaxID=239 RepID=UPI0025BFF6AC|nr:hypothetical protein [Flavobacterium sp.]